MTSSSSHFVTSLIALVVVFQVTFYPFLAADAQLIPGIPILGALRLTDRLACCNTTQSSCLSSGLANVTISLSCTNIVGVASVVGTAITDANGLFTMTIPASLLRSLGLGDILGLVGGLLPGTLLPCVATATVPLDSAVCLVGNTVSLVGNTITTATGVVRFAVTTVTTLVDGVLGRVLLTALNGAIAIGIGN